MFLTIFLRFLNRLNSFAALCWTVMNKTYFPHRHRFYIWSQYFENFSIKHEFR